MNNTKINSVFHILTTVKLLSTYLILIVWIALPCCREWVKFNEVMLEEYTWWLLQSRICFSVAFNLKVVLSVPQVRDICDSISQNMVYSPVVLRKVVPNWCHKKNCFHQQGLLLTYGHLKLYGSIKMYHRVRLNMNCFMILTFESMVLTWPLAFPQDKCVLLFSRNLLWTLKYWKSNCTFPPFFMSPFSC